MIFQNEKPKIGEQRSNAIRMVSASCTMLFKGASVGWRTFSVKKGSRVGSSFNRDIIIGNSFAYGKGEK
jgi:hypothetical protein